MQINMPMLKKTLTFILPATALPDARVAEQITLKSIQENIADLKHLPYPKEFLQSNLFLIIMEIKLFTITKETTMENFLLSIIH